MATVHYVDVVFSYEDNRGNLTGDTDQFHFYAPDVTGDYLALGAAGGKTFVFTRGNCRITDIVCNTATVDCVGLQLYVNNLPRNVRWRKTSLLGASPNRIPSPVRLAGGSQVEFVEWTL
jgi:hypothetical protein